MPAPEFWFDPIRFGTLYGALAGGVGGTVGGLLGALLGWLAPKGRGRAPLTAAFAALAVFGLASLIGGVAALVMHQPYGIWYPLLLVGVIMGTVCTITLFVTIPRAYAAAEVRRLAAEELRQASLR